MIFRLPVHLPEDLQRRTLQLDIFPVFSLHRMVGVGEDATAVHHRRELFPTAWVEVFTLWGLLLSSLQVVLQHPASIFVNVCTLTG